MSASFTFGSVCSGIEAASMAWHPLGWRAAFLSEIDAFPRAVLKHHFPGVPLHGRDQNKGESDKDYAAVAGFQTIEGHEYGTINLLVGGTPCQDYSVAGKRAGLGGERGNLTLEYARLARRSGARWLVWENVPGVFSLNGGRDFGAVIADFAGYPEGSIFEPPPDGWQSFGIVPAGGPLGYGLAWAVLDAQYFGLAQRRARVFVVGYLGDWRRAAAVLLEREGLLGNPPPRREKGKGLASGALRSTDGGSDLEHARGGQLVPETVGALTDGAHNGGGLNRQDAYTGRIFPVPMPTAFKASHFTRGKDGAPSDVAPPLSADADKGDQDTLIAFAELADPLPAHDRKYTHEGRGNFRLSNVVGAPVAFDTTQITHPENRSNPQPDAPTPTLAKGGHPPAIAFSAKDYGADAGEISPTLRSGGHDKSHANGGVMPAVAFPINTQIALRHKAMGEGTGLGIGSPQDPAFTLQSAHSHAVGFGSAVRRLTPRECERLQGFPDDYTLIPYRGKPAADGPRYKALGNSMAVPVMRWIGERIAMVEQIVAESEGRK